jgi:hypothetical protein
LYNAGVKARKLGQFMTGEDTKIRSVALMTPLKQRPAGAFMSPLKGEYMSEKLVAYCGL